MTNYPNLTLRRTILGIFCSIMLITPVAFAAEQQNPDPATGQDSASEEQDSAQSEGNTRAGKKPGNSAKDKGDIFTPSEEISEDFAVSFPVDI